MAHSFQLHRLNWRSMEVVHPLQLHRLNWRSMVLVHPHQLHRLNSVVSLSYLFLLDPLMLGKPFKKRKSVCASLYATVNKKIWYVY